MAYLGKSPSLGVRNRYYFTASGNETSISGALTGGTLTFSDGAYVDVMLNGVTLVAGTDYNTTTANTIAGLTALVASDVVEIIVYDVFSVFGGNMAADLKFGDNVKSIYGAGSDLQIYHDGTDSHIDVAGTLNIDGSGETLAKFIDDGAVELYHNNAKKIETTATGVDVTGVITGGTLEATADTSAGDNAAIGYTSAEGLILTGQGSTSDITLKNDADATVFTVPTGTDDILFPDSAKILMGNSSDLQLYHDGSNSYINETGDGDLYIRTSNEIRIQDGNQSNFLYAVEDGDLRLYHNGSEKLRTASTGVDITGAFTATDGCTITTADNTSQLTLISTDTDVNRGPQLDLHRNSSSPADNDTLAFVRFMGQNDAGEATVYAEFESLALDVSNGTEDGIFSISVMGAGSLGERMRIDNEGGVRIGTTANIFNSPQFEQVSIKNPGQGNALTLQATDVSGGFPILYLYTSDTAASQSAIFFQRHASTAGSITTTNTSVAYNTSSDYRLKTAVTYDWDATTRLKQLKPARFKWIADGDDAVEVDGFLAHEAATVVPEAVSGTKDETRDVENAVLSSTGFVLHRGIAEADWTAGKLATTDGDGNTVDALYPSDSTWAASHTEDVMQGIDQAKLVPLLCKTILELEARITALETA